MPNGVEILKKTLFFQDTPMGIRIFLLVTAIVALILGLFLVIKGLDEMCDCFESDMFELVGGILFFLGFICLPGFITMVATPPEPDRYEYVVQIEDTDASAKEIYEKYDVIDMNENIWTIRDKDKK